jgi:cytochrome c-type biogenesis protein CcmH/NrfF
MGVYVKEEMPPPKMAFLMTRTQILTCLNRILAKSNCPLAAALTHKARDLTNKSHPDLSIFLFILPRYNRVLA